MRYALIGCLFLVKAMPAGAEVKFDRDTIQLGEIRSGAPLYQRFQFVNRGTTMKIKGARASCGCLQPRLERHTYQNNEQGRLLFLVHTLGESAGPQSWKVFFQYEQDGKIHEKVLKVSATIRKEILVQPAALLIRTEGAVTHQITVTDTRKTPINIRKLLSSAQGITSTVKSTSTNEQGQRVYLLELKVGDDFPEGRKHEVLSIHTDDEDYRELQIPMTIEKHAKKSVQASPASIRLSGSKGAALPSRIVLLRSASDENILVDRILPKHPAVSCQWAKGPGKMATMKIRIDADKMEKKSLKTSVDVWINAPTVSVVTIPIQCELR